jgi:hypothetical protein
MFTTKGNLIKLIANNHTLLFATLLYQCISENTIPNCEWLLTIEPPNRNNAYQSYDGWFPRRYSQVSAAKAAVTRKSGREWKWQDA